MAEEICVIYKDEQMSEIGIEFKNNNNFRFIYTNLSAEDDIIKEASGADGIIVQYAPITKKVIDSLSNLKVIVRTGIGMDNVDIQAAAEKSIQVCNVPDYCTEEVANHALALTFALHRNLFSYSSVVKKGLWTHVLEKPINRFDSLRVGLFGFGKISKSIASKLKPFGCEIVAVRKSVIPGQTCNTIKIVSFEELVHTSDIIIINAALNDETYHIFDFEIFRKMKKNSIIINTSRGLIIKEEDLIKALKEREIAGAGLDVFEKEGYLKDNPLTQMENVICTPHVAYYSKTSLDELRKKSTEEAVRVLNGEKPLNPVNLNKFY